LQPQYSYAWYDRAIYKINSGDINNGLADLRKAVEIGKSAYIESTKESKNFERIRNNEEFKKILGIDTKE
jgi:hypothetical protein